MLKVNYKDPFIVNFEDSFIVFIINFEHVSHLALVFLLLILNM